MENKKIKAKKEPVSKTRILKIFGLYGAGVAVVIFLIFVVFSIIETFPNFVPISNANNLLQIWVTTNGVLMGFVGIVFAQLISSTTNQQNVLYQHILEEKNTDHKPELMKILDFLDLRRIFLCLFTVVALICLAYSILVSMKGLADLSLLKSTDVYAVNGFMTGPLFYSVVGILFLIFGLVMPLKPPMDKSK